MFYPLWLFILTEIPTVHFSLSYNCLSDSRYSLLKEIACKITQQLAKFQIRVKSEPNEIAKISKGEAKHMKQSDSYIKFKQIKEQFCGIGVTNIKFAQVVVSVQSNNDPEVNLSVGRVNNTITLSTRPDRLCSMLSIDCLTFGLKTRDYSRLLLNPWSFSVEVCPVLH